MRELVSGSGVDRLISLNDLTSSGLAGSDSSGNLIGPAQPFLASPPAPTNVTATAAIRNIIVEWDAPNYPGHAYAEVWGASTNSLTAAVLLGMTPGGIYVDETGPSVTRFYWVRFVNTNDVKGAYNAISGVSATTGPEVSYLLSTLTGAITETQLFSSLGARINLVDGAASLPGSVNARVQTESTARQNADSALSSQITTLSSTVGQNTTAIQQEATTRANADGTLFAQYTVKIDTNGYVSGFGLASTANNATPFSDFIIRADRFSIASPSGPGIAPVIPFIVTTTSQVINGVTVPPGTYIKDGFIQNGVITNAKIGNLAVDDAKIASLSVGKLTAGSIAAGQFIQSSNYVPDTQGFRLDANGNAFLQNAVVRGTVFATAGTFAGSLSAATGTFSGSLSAATGSFAGSLSAATGTFSGSLTAATGSFAGSLSAATGTFSGSLSAATGSFAGSLSAATGTFSGSLTANAVNAVNTINLAGQAVTIPASVFTAGVIATNTSWQTVQTLTYTSSGNPTNISGFFSPTFGTLGGRYDARIILNGTVVLGPIPGAPYSAVYVSVLATPAAGIVTIQLQVQSEANSFRFVENRGILSLEVKR
jgi:predicted phage tail protein